MRQLRLIGRSMVIKSDKTNEVIIKIVLICSIVVIGCEVYLLNKL